MFKDPSLWAVVGGNIFAMVLATTESWSFSEILWTYWFQSILIGIINAYRMGTLKKFSTAGVTSNDQPVPETRQAQKEMTGFFVFHYGFFHFGYALFLINDMPISLSSPATAISLVLAFTGFIAAHVYSYKHNKLHDFKDSKPNLGTLMFYPYLRIIPMHLVIVFGLATDSVGLAGIIPFMIMKTFADAGMHAIEHRIFRKA